MCVCVRARVCVCVCVCVCHGTCRLPECECWSLSLPARRADNFVGETNREKEEEHDRLLNEKRAMDSVGACVFMCVRVRVCVCV